jgi:hypothetical protein
MKSQKVSPEQLAQIRSLDDFDVTMLISEIHDNGWPQAARTLGIMIEAQSRGPKDISGRAFGRRVKAAVRDVLEQKRTQ